MGMWHLVTQAHHRNDCYLAQHNPGHRFATEGSVGYPSRMQKTDQQRRPIKADFRTEYAYARLQLRHLLTPTCHCMSAVQRPGPPHAELLAPQTHRPTLKQRYCAKKRFLSCLTQLHLVSQAQCVPHHHVQVHKIAEGSFRSFSKLVEHAGLRARCTSEVLVACSRVLSDASTYVRRAALVPRFMYSG